MIPSHGLKRYLLYAVGEIVLVVLGILIALQINDWSEARKEREKERTYLQAIREDLEREQISVKKMMARRKSKIRSAAKIWAIYTDSAETDSLGYHIGNVALWETITPGMNTWKELISTGDLHLIRNKEIKAGLANLMARYDRVNVLQHTHHRREYEVYYYDQLFNTIDFNEAFPGMLDYNQADHPLALEGQKAVQFYQKIKENLILKNGIQVVSSANKSGLKHAGWLDQEITGLLQLIQKELDSTR